MRGQFWRNICAVWVLVSSLNAEAAEIELETVPTEAGGSLSLIFIAGEMVPGDDAKFANLAIRTSSAVVVLDSPGGDLKSGIEIGNAIRIKGFATWVPDEFSCASACALAWLGGRQRLMGPGARVGFHAVSRLSDQTNSADSVGNALVGAYLSQLGLPTSAIAYITTAQPTEIQWLSFEDAERIGIDVRELSLAKEEARRTPPPQNPPVYQPALNQESWVQIFSRRTLPEILGIASEYESRFGNLHAFQYDNGWFVLALGPYSNGEAPKHLRTLMASGRIPNDSLVVSGTRFARRVWSATSSTAYRPPRSPTQQALEAAESIFRITSLPNAAFIEALNDLYPPMVVYFGKPTKKEDVIKDKAKFAQRWPSRTYTIMPNTVQADCSPEGKCHVEGIIEWYVFSSTRNATSEGTARFSIDLLVGDAPTIFAESSSVLSRAVHEKPKTVGVLPSRIGQCERTAIIELGSRLVGVAGSGSAVSYANGGFQVSYDMLPGLQRSKLGDSVTLCLVSIPANCPPGDDRGRVYEATNLRTGEKWRAPDASHMCGGA